MNRAPYGIATLLLCACGAEQPMPPAQAPQPPTAAMDESAAAELKAFNQQVFDAINAGDVAAFKGSIAADSFLVSFENGPDGTPVRVDSAEAEGSAMDQAMAAARAAGGKMQVTVKRADCRGTATFGTCAVEYDATMPMPGGHAMTLALRGLGVARKGADGWKWVAWHESPAALPPAPPQAAMPAAKLDPAAMNKADLKWMEVEGFPVFSIAPLWENPQTHAVAVLGKIAKVKSPPHQHTMNAWIFVEKGTFSITGTDGKRYEAKAGGWVLQPAHWTHVTECQGSCQIAMVTDGPFDMGMADNKGAVASFAPVKLVPPGSQKAAPAAKEKGAAKEIGEAKEKGAAKEKKAKEPAKK
jgi:ketosteroid isomerase-like protein/quercetin dioxygenase-like cupin family protein